jgi:hypothetical protein
MPKSKFDPQKHHRRSIRLQGYDYVSEGAYFVTIVTDRRALRFGKIVKGEMILKDLGKIADDDENPHKINVKPGSYRANKEQNATGIWQRNVYEHVIRDEKAIQRITDYIDAKPSRWDEDDNNKSDAHSR